MDTIIIKDDNNKYYVAAFLLFIFIVIIIVVIILFVVPKSTVALFGACTDQSECSSGLICTKSSGTGGICLGGLNYQCNNNSDCSKNYICLDNSFSNTKVCMFQPQITTSSTFQTSPTFPTASPITVAPVINLALPQNITTSFATPCNTQYNTVNYNPQAILNSILPASCPSNYGTSAGFGNTREFRSFAPMGITTGKKKL
jgi:hypothetical protein